MTTMTIPEFPCKDTPENGPLARLLGLYNQRHEGHMLQRLKTPGGRMTLRQWRKVAEVAQCWSETGILHLTTRQSIEIHGLASESIPAIHRALHEAGLTSVGAAGDTPRNITVCPDGGLKPGSHDLLPLADAIQQAIDALPFRFELPRKFKISLSCGIAGCGRPWMNDLGFIMNEDESYRAIVGGSLGARPALGILGYDHLISRDVVALTIGAIRLFNDEGDRSNRSRARLRHARERMGDELFRQRLDEYFQEARRETLPAVPSLEAAGEDEKPMCHLKPSHGHLSCDEILELVDCVERHDGEIRIGLEHDLLVTGLEKDQLSEAFARLTKGPSIIACPGAHSCARGIAETWGIADAIRMVLPAGTDFMIGISGCPNNCAHAAVSDIGLLGKVKTVNGIKMPHFRLMAGGGRGSTPALGRDLHRAVPAERVAEVVAMLTESWQASELYGVASFAEHIEREWSNLTDQVSEMSLLAQE